MKALWKGGISFGLLYIPVELYSATEQHRLDLHMLRKKDLCPIEYVRVCKRSGEEVAWDDIVKGYEYEDGDYVVLQDKDFADAAVKKSKTIEIQHFVEAEEIDPKYFVKPYYIVPSKEAGKIYSLLREALKKSGKVGVASFVLRQREHLGVLIVEDDVLILQELRFADEIRSSDALAIPAKGRHAKKEVTMAMDLIDSMTEHFEPKKYKDSYKRELEKTIVAKAENRPMKKAKGVAVKPTASKDVVADLRKSLERAHKKRSS